MKTRALLACLAVSVGTMGIAFADPSDDEFFPPQNFEGFTVGATLVGQGSWLERGSAVTPLAVLEGPLVYAAGGVGVPTGNSIELGGPGQDARIEFPAITPADGNTYYWSAVVMWDGTNVIDDETYVAGFLATANNSTAVRNIMTIRGINGDFFIGARLGATSGAQAVYPAEPLLPNTPVFVVMKYTEVGGGLDNDTTEMFIFRTTPVPEQEPATATVVATNNVPGQLSSDIQNNSAHSIQQFSVRQFTQGGSTGFPTNTIMHNIRAGSTWESVTYVEPVDTNVDEWMMY